MGGEKARKLNVLVLSSNARKELGEGYLSVPVSHFPNIFVSSLSDCFLSISYRDFRGSAAIFNMARPAVNQSTVDAMQDFMRSE